MIPTYSTEKPQGKEQNTETFVEVGYFQLCKYNQKTEGDVFLSQKNPADGRVITTLSDGLGSGVKAGVLATLTATMATKFIANDIPIRRAAEIIMNTLPVCKQRGISYATFTLVDIAPNSTVRIMEYDNPPYILVRQETVVEPIKDITPIERKNKKTAPKKESFLQYSKYEARPGDRLIFFSDGVTQSGMGTPCFPFGWGSNNVQEFILDKIRCYKDISARDLARSVVQEASMYDGYTPKDDITCGVVYFRNPRDMLVMTGPPVHPENDSEIARIFSLFDGHKVICGGTTANILSRELNRPIKVSLKDFDPKVPPSSSMEGADMVTEGIITMGAVSEILENDANLVGLKTNAATKMVELFLNCDRIWFVVGTKINEAHQDPNMPVELEIRRNVVKKIASLLQDKYLKEVNIQYF
ncbi:MAG: SpoIIE family protein phosphatase [Candidatus Treponema excrementipullorum]|nr:serine/threonine-protein phosphatase [Spirochaetia bacterium]MDD7012583.1 SpoIIE family protein phosphatase [Candidatus Treponema excrementipullorum]MCI6954093.1 serine/threonine-protein phosphatase [Spirochaetia bacterium]MCI7588772.1 serine/threonine-protein phosphatase [Spirochaetia bacterium]MDY2756772.1 SpoIIE family protein phosphatase [Candidatus Treponema excrementipullorum]